MSNILDTRDLNKRLEELQGLKQTLDDAREELATHMAQEIPEDEDELEAFDETREELEAAVTDAESEFGEDEQTELDELENLENEVSEWRHGETLIPESYFTEYVEGMLKDCGDLPQDIPWYIAIDWDKTADNVRADYSTVTYQGTDYYVRN